MEETKKKLAAALMDEALAAAADLPGKRPGASYRDTLVGIGIAVDKAQPLTGEPTRITAQADAQVIALKAIEALFKLARERDPRVTLEDVTRRYCAHKPELRPLLMPPEAPGLALVGEEP